MICEVRQEVLGLPASMPDQRLGVMSTSVMVGLTHIYAYMVTCQFLLLSRVKLVQVARKMPRLPPYPPGPEVSQQGAALLLIGLTQLRGSLYLSEFSIS